jgi:hypothetical protein
MTVKEGGNDDGGWLVVSGGALLMVLRLGCFVGGACCETARD